MLDALALVAWRRPWTLIGAGAALLAALTALALGAPDELGIGDAGGGATAEQPDMVVVTRADFQARSRVYKVALDAVSSRLEADPEVAAVSAARVGDKRQAVLLVDLAPTDEAARQAAVQRIEGGIDPGPLRLLITGRTKTLLDARDSVGGDLWRLELLALPFALLMLVAAFGVRLAAAPLLCAAIAIVGALACLRFAGALADPSLLAIAPAAALGLVLGIELPTLLMARVRDEAELGGPPERALRLALDDGVPALGFAVLAAVLAAAGLVASASAQAGSIVFACACAAVLALAATAFVVPAFLALAERVRIARAPESDGAEREARDEAPLTRLLAELPGALARGSWRTGLATAASVAALLALAEPALDARGTELGLTGAPSSGGSLLGELPLAAALAAGLLAVTFGLRAGSARAALLAPAALLPAAAAVGMATAVFQQGTLAELLGQVRQDALQNAAVASFVPALAAIGAARCAVALDAARSERELDPGPTGVAERAGGLTLPAAFVATLIAGAAAAVLGGAELYAAREFGIALASGLALDLLLVRSCALAALARWGTPGRALGPGMRSVAWRRWRARRRAEGTTGRPS